MKFGSLNEVFEGNKSLFDIVNESYTNNFNSYNKYNYLIDKPKKGKISKFLKLFSNYGMSYDDQVLKNMVAVPANKDLQQKDALVMQNLYGMPNLDWKVKSEEDRPFSEKTLNEKRTILRKMAEQPEIEDILDIMCNECIVYDSDNNYICKPFIDNAVLQDLNENALNEVRTAINSIFYKIYMLEDLKRNAWNLFRRFLVDGVLAYEIVYDNLQFPKNIIGIIELDPATLTKCYDGINLKWIQYKGVQGKERILLDSQVIYIKYADDGVTTRQSYLERLIRPFNIYRIIEQAQIIWTVTQSSFKTMFTIPVGSMNRAKGMQELSQQMSRYKEDISFNNDTGELKVNGKVNLPFNKEYWMPENENGKPEIETLVDQGPQINDSEQLKYFLSKLYKMSKIPESRFDKENGATWFGTDASQVLRDEINFGRFVERIRHAFSEIIIKPIQIQLSLTIPDLKNDKRILESISIDFISYNQFQELMEAEVDQKRMEHIQTLKDTFTTTDADGNEVPYFCDKFLIIKYLKMSDADLELNEKYKMEMKNDAKDNEEGNNEEDNNEDNNNEDNDEGSGLDMSDENDNSEEDNSDKESDEGNNGEIDKEMLGDVQPESSETTEA